MQAVNKRTMISLLGIVGCQVLFVNSVCAESVGLSDTPLYIKRGVIPNVFLTVDDSVSMNWSHVPDEIYVKHDTKRAKSSAFNKIYYDPGVKYLPAVDASGNSLGDSDFDEAWDDGFNQSGKDTCKINLNTSYRATWCGHPSDTNRCDKDNHQWKDEYRQSVIDNVLICPEYAGPVNVAPGRAYYYEYNGTGNKDDDGSYTIKHLDTAEEKKNFANWYSYYRTRMLTAKTAMTRSFSSIKPLFRISQQKINSPTLTPLSDFSGDSRTNFFNWVNGVTTSSSGTPLRAAFVNVGEKLKSSDDPYRDDPSDPTSETRSCRQNLHILMTDGEWNKTVATTIGNLDKTIANLPENPDGIEKYTARDPYVDDNVDYLADFAFKYWYTDLRDLPNNVPASETKLICPEGVNKCTTKTKDKEKTFWHPNNDPATWQHLVNYTVGFGIAGELSFPSDFDDLLVGTKTWGTNKVDDLWHAAINSRGRYLSANDPDQLVKSFTSILNNVLKRGSSASPVSLNSGSVSSVTRLYQATFDSSDWTGKLYSRPISDGTNASPCTTNDAIGEVCAPEWEASCKLDGGPCDATGTTEVGPDWRTGRKIITYKPGDDPGIAFDWDSLSSEQQDQLKVNGTIETGKLRLNYIRGDKSHEAFNYDPDECPDCTFRNRNSLLGDLINSNPTYVGVPSRIYPDSLDGSGDSTHTAFRSTQSERQGMVYVGGNDGMLHAFAASDGTEKLAYIPDMIFPKLASLTDDEYSHISFVDGQLEEGDVYFGDAWHTVLVGGLGYGGQGIYALDITSPDTFSEENANNIVLWEYSDANANADASDLGYTYGKPVIRKLNNGKWAAIFGNGYDSTASDDHISTTGDAAIYIVDIEDGSLIKKITTEVGSAEDPTEASRPNGIAGIQPVDIDGDFKIDYLYAGDLFGNVWRFDLLGSEIGNWDVAFSRKPLYQAEDGDGHAQPITTITAVGRHETHKGAMVYFGTGKYIGINDITDTSQQTFYAIWDSWIGSNTVFTAPTRTHLLQQQVSRVDDASFDNIVARVTTNNTVNWAIHKGWYLDLPESGERVYQPPMLRNGRIIFVTVTPSDDPCRAGGASWLMELDAHSGSRLDTSPFDYDGDGVFSEEDQVTLSSEEGAVKVGGSGIRLNPGGGAGGIYTAPAVLNIPSSNKERKYIGTSEAKVEAFDERSYGRLNLSWREIMECGI